MNFMPFGQLKSFLKILIEVQYEINNPLFRYALAASSMRLCHISYYFSIKWLTPFYPANPSQAAGGGEKCMDLRFLRLRRWLLKQQPNKTVFNRFIEN